MVTSSINGLVSGLNTSQIISQLMQVEAAPQQALQARVTAQQALLSAYQSINSKFSSLLTSANAVTDPLTWQSVKATSSDASVAATATAGSTTGSITFDVVSTAARETYLSSQTYASMSATALSGTSFTLTNSAGVATTITPTDGSLGSVITAINNSNTGVKATAVSLGNGSFALQLSSTATGAAAGFTQSGLNGTFVETSKASDAVIRFGAGTAAQHDVTSATNTFTNVMPGLTLTVSAVKTGVTVTTATDSGAIADSVNAMVTAANAALDEIAKYSSYDASAKSGGPLMSDFTVRMLQQKVLDAVSTAVGTGTATTAGLSVTKDGHLSFDRAKFLSSYNTDPAGLQNLLGPSITFTPAAAYTGSVTMRRAAATSTAGTYALTITQAATKANAQVNVTGAIDATTSVTVGGVTVTGAAGDTATTFTAKINTALSAQGYNATLTGSTITITAGTYGSGGSFTPTVAGSGVTAGPVTAGRDVAGSINGVAATGFGQVLTAATTSPAAGLSLLVTLTPADVASAPGGAVGSFSFNAGVAQRLANLSNTATDPLAGSLTNAMTSTQSQINGYNTQIANWDVRLQLYQQNLQRQFSQLEVALGKLKDQGNWLSGQIASLPTGGTG